MFCKSLTEYLVVNVQVETGNIVDDFQKSQENIERDFDPLPHVIHIIGRI